MGRTKIVCTIGPATESEEKISALIDAGMSVARLNFSHRSHDEHRVTIERLKKVRKARGVPLAIMLDTKGPEIRLGTLPPGGITVKPKDKIVLVKEPQQGSLTHIAVTPPAVLDILKTGITVLFDDGYVASKVVDVKKGEVVVEIQNSGLLTSHKGVNLPGVAVPLPAMTEQDVRDISFGCENDIDLIAASFIRSAEHVQEIRALLAKKGKPETLILAKIENSLGVENFDEILGVADGIMVARGDLGVELPLKQVPRLQKMMIHKSILAAKPVTTATQMLESMIKNPRPTRAEVSDVANAVYDSTSAVMLSGETAVGEYPVEAVRMMHSIIEETETDLAYYDLFLRDAKIAYDDISISVALAAVRTAYSAQAKAIFAFTCSGLTARLISRFRPEMPIFAFTGNLKTYHQLASYWGVIPVPPAEMREIEEAFAAVCAYGKSIGRVKKGDLVVVTSGSPFGQCGSTNTMIVQKVV
jgi:pyruvate kinase